MLRHKRLSMSKLDDIEKLLEGATPGKWGSDHRNRVFIAGEDGKPAPRTGMRPAGDAFPHIANTRREDDADFIASAPDSLRYLLRVAKAAQLLAAGLKPKYLSEDDAECLANLRAALEGKS
jgi:hypothetical protein